MRRVLVLLVGALLLAIANPGQSQNPQLVAPTEARSPEDERKALHVPPGFEVQLVAADPDIQKPMNIAFDARGRLWVTDTIEYPYPAADGSKARDTVKVLEDFGPDGRARKITTFATGLNIPIGLLPLRDGALVHSIPDVFRLTDTTGDGKADKREPLYRSVGFRDTHGMTNAFSWGFDGWIYACHGFSNTSTLKANGGKGPGITMNSGNTYRIKADGSAIEQYTWGQVNPFGLAFDPLGNLYSADCHTKPVTQLLRDGYYQSFVKPHDGLGYAPDMCFHDHGSTGIGGIVYYAADQFPPEYRDTVYLGNVVTSRVNHDKIQWTGSTPRAVQQPDFVTSDDPWFRPVDLKLGPDGALYIADFYNRIIGHYEVPLEHPGRDRHRGRIWRIVYRGPDGKGAAKPPRQDWTKATPAELFADLGHPNLTVRMFATNQLVQHGPKGCEVLREELKKGSNAWQRIHSLWVHERCDVLTEYQLLAAAADADRAVRVHAVRILSERKELTESHRALLLKHLDDADANVQRAAADALGRHPRPEQIRPLLARRYTVPTEDTHLLHVVRMALRDQLRTPEAWQVVGAGTWDERDLKAIADVALGVPSKEAAQFLLAHVGQLGDDFGRLTLFVHHVARHGDAATDDRLLTWMRGRETLGQGQQGTLLRELDRGTQERDVRLSPAAREWASALIPKLLASSRPGQVNLGIELAASLRLSGAEKSLTAVALRRDAGEAQRVAAVNALVTLAPKESVALLGRLLTDAGEVPGLRDQAAGALARTNQPEAQAQLLQALPLVPARQQTAIALGLAGSRTGAEKLLEAITAGKASAQLLRERPIALRLAESRLPNLKERLEKLTAGLPTIDQRLQELIQQRRTGYARAKPDVALGAKMFEKHCATCHQIAGKGQKIGPQLDGIGVRGLERLLEDTIDPNRNVDQAFRSTLLTLGSGQQVTGLLLKEEGEILVLADAQGKEVRVPKKSVDERATSQLSPMPANFVEQVSEAEFYHLLAFLLSQRQANGQR